MIRAALLLAALLPVQAFAFPVKEVEKTYPVSGGTGMALYDSIGANGPRIRDGAAGAIAYTTFDLKWRRDYRPAGSACVLRAAKPFLTITYTLPEPRGKLAPGLAARWTAFIGGIRAHEHEHGAMIRELVDDIVATTVGHTTQGDPKCRKIRAEVFSLVKAAYARHTARSRAFDREEMGPGGGIHRLIVGLVK